MAPQTEAECLLGTGAMYGRRLLLRGGTGAPVFAGFKPGGFSLYFGDAPIVHFDREGRWQRAFRDGLHYLKGLDAAVQTIDRVREGENLVLKRKSLNHSEVGVFDEWVRTTAVALTEALDSGRLIAVEPPTPRLPIRPEELRAFLGRVAGWDAPAWDAHRLRYLDTYGPLPFLPPDCPAPVVVQATLGHEGGLAFGGAPAAGHAVRSPDEFEAHARAVAALLGRRVEQCKSVFLGGSDVLLRPVGDVTAYLEILGRVFPIDAAGGPRPRSVSADAPPSLGGVHAFLDRFDARRHDRDALRSHRAGGLVRVSLGVESGAPEVRARYAKTWTDDALRAAVADLKAAGIGVGVIALVGAGGEGDAGRDPDATAALLKALELGPGDLVSLIDAEEIRGPDPAGLTAAARAERLDALKTRLAPIRTERGAKVVSYSLEKQGLS